MITAEEYRQQLTAIQATFAVKPLAEQITDFTDIVLKLRPFEMSIDTKTSLTWLASDENRAICTNIHAALTNHQNDIDGTKEFLKGWLSHHGIGTNENYHRAVASWKISAKKGFAEAQHNLGYSYFHGNGVKINDEKAIKWITAAAEQGHAHAQSLLGIYYLNGVGVPNIDKDEAIKWFTAAATQGHAHAQYILGQCYDNGVLNLNKEEATKWWARSADQGYAEAQFLLGICHLNGDGLPNADKDEAIKWWRKAAEQGHAKSQFILGNCYNNGGGEQPSGVMHRHNICLERLITMARVPPSIISRP